MKYDDHRIFSTEQEKARYFSPHRLYLQGCDVAGKLKPSPSVKHLKGELDRCWHDLQWQTDCLPGLEQEADKGIGYWGIAYHGYERCPDDWADCVNSMNAAILSMVALVDILMKQHFEEMTSGGEAHV